MSTTLQKNRVRNLLPTPFGEFDRLMDDFFGPRSAGWHTPASVWEAEDKLHVELDVPGVALEDVDLTFEKGVLRISVERHAREDQRTNWHNERGFGRVTRSLSLPDVVDPDSIDASLDRGVLHVTIAKLPEAQPRKIQIKAS